ncbi:MAG: NAD(P)-dependent alcohol dehydrogenase [Leptospiraceae bacterium]|nr:NAD(P)-dependent alcohol dehydrogenase [Leptospiraceae bacterium]
MKAVVFDKKSSTEKLVYCDLEKPTPGEDELLIEIHASSINAADYRMLQMGFPPKKKIFGADVSGRVESVGKNIKNFKIGDPVVGELSGFGFGGLAEYVSAPQKAFLIKPDEISFEDAAAFPLAATTALQAIRNFYEIKKGSRVLIIGSSGGVGTFAVQIAKYLDAIVTGVCSSKNKEQTLLLGADHVIEYDKVNLNQLDERYDLVLGINGDYPLRLYKKLLKPHGTYLMVGGSLGQIFRSIFFGWMMSFGSQKMLSLSAKSNIEDMEFVFKLASEGKIKPVIDRSFHLSETPEAFRYMREKHAAGKIIIKVR